MLALTLARAASASTFFDHATSFSSTPKSAAGKTSLFEPSHEFGTPVALLGSPSSNNRVR